jgi:hypothetical protein
MNSQENCRKCLDELAQASVRFRPKNNSLVDLGSKISASFCQLNAEQRQGLLDTIDASLNMKLLALCGFTAEAALNTREPTLIRTALILHLIEDFRKDYRETFRYLVLTSFAAKTLNIDLKASFESLAQFGSVRANQNIKDFLGRSDELNALSMFGLKEDWIDGRFQFSAA